MGSRKKQIKKPKPKSKPKKRLTKEQRKRSEAAKKGWETRRRKAKVAALRDKVRKRRAAAIKGWETRRARGWKSKGRRYEPTAQAIIDKQAAEIKRLQRMLDIKERTNFILANEGAIKQGHKKELVKFKGTKGYGLQKKVQSIFLDYQMIYENQRELYDLYEEGIT